METKNLKSSENELKKSSEMVEKKSVNAADKILNKLAEKRKQNDATVDAVSEKKMEKVIKDETVIETVSEKKVEKVIKDETVIETVSEKKVEKVIKNETVAGRVEKTKEEKEVENKEIKTVTKETVSSEKVIIEDKKEESSERAEVKKEPEIIQVNYNELSKKELIEKLELLLEQPVMTIKDEVEKIKSVFYKKLKVELAESKQKFIEAGGNEREFKVEPSEEEKNFKETYKKFQELKTQHNNRIEQAKKDNLEQKLNIIERIENLVNTQETLNNTFDVFKELQQKWKEIGIVPQEATKDLWSKYNFANEKFYDYVKINRELRDLDLKKNREIKIDLCEKAEKLILVDKIIKAFQELQLLHIKWKETGPVPKENRDDIWERFKETTSIINKRHHDFFQELKTEQENNLKAKTLICDKVEEIANSETITHKDWKEKTTEVIDLQKMWRLIGFAPKKENNEIYHRFRNLCDNFFDKKREYYNSYNEELDNNLQLKTDLCVQVDNLKDNTEWRKTTDSIIEIQKKWKLIGHVPKKDFEQLRKRFTESCNHFFNKKKSFFSDRQKQEEDNFKSKQALIQQIKEIDTAQEDSFGNLQTLQKEWTKIGFVPFKHKDEIYKEFQTVVNDKFSNFKIDSKKRDSLHFNSKLENMVKAPNARTKISYEIEKLKNNLATINDEIRLWENNMGFFAKSKNAESMISDFNKKIDKAKKEADSLKNRIVMLEKANKKL